MYLCTRPDIAMQMQTSTFTFLRLTVETQSVISTDISWLSLVSLRMPGWYLHISNYSLFPNRYIKFAVILMSHTMKQPANVTARDVT